MWVCVSVWQWWSIYGLIDSISVDSFLHETSTSPEPSSISPELLCHSHSRNIWLLLIINVLDFGCLFVPSIRHSFLSALTPALLRGRGVLRSGSAHTAWERIRCWSSPDLFVSLFLLRAPAGKTPVLFVYQSLLPMHVLLITAEDLSWNHGWGWFNFTLVCICCAALSSVRRTKNNSSTQRSRLDLYPA